MQLIVQSNVSCGHCVDAQASTAINAYVRQNIDDTTDCSRVLRW